MHCGRSWGTWRDLPGGEDQHGTPAASCISSSCRAPSWKESETFASLSSSPHPRSEAAGPLPSGKTSLFCDRHCCRLLGNSRRIATHRFFNHPRRQPLLLWPVVCARQKEPMCTLLICFSCTVLLPFFLMCILSTPSQELSACTFFFPFRFYHFSANCECCQPAALHVLESFPNLFVLSSVGRGGALVEVQS